jgi:hypothetical protein
VARNAADKISERRARVFPRRGEYTRLPRMQTSRTCGEAIDAATVERSAMTDLVAGARPGAAAGRRYRSGGQI